MTKEAFSQLVVQYERLVYTICFQLVRDTMPAGYERQWLARIAANKAKDHLQSAYNRRTVLPGDEEMPPGSSRLRRRSPFSEAGKRIFPT